MTLAPPLQSAAIAQAATHAAANPLWARGLRRAGVALSGLALPVLLLALWQHATVQHWLPEQLLPPPLLVWQSLLDLWQSGDLQGHIAISLSRIGWSFLLGAPAGLLLGFGMGLSRQVRAYLGATFEVLAQFPVVGWVPLLIVFCGIGEPLKLPPWPLRWWCRSPLTAGKASLISRWLCSKSAACIALTHARR